MRRGLGRGVRRTGRALAAPARVVLVPAARVLAANADLAVAVVAVVLFVIAWPTLSLTHDVTPSLQPVIAAAEVAPLLLARVRGFLAWGLAVVVAFGFWVAGTAHADWPMPWPVIQFLVLLALVVVVCLRERWEAVLCTIGGTAVLFALALPPDLKAWAFGQAVLAVMALLVRWLVLSRRELARETEASELERARRAVLEERSLIARELHDIVAHHMSLIVVQAQSAPYRLPDVGDDVREEFASIERSARAALNEVRGVLGVLRAEDQERLGAPVPGGSDVERLLDASRSAGLELSWDPLPSALGEVPAALGLAAYRILQESLANASRHAPGARTHASVRLADGSLQVAVVNGPPPGAGRPPHESGGGSGILGMRTRAESVGGSLDAGPTPDGGWQVSALLPLGAADAGTPVEPVAGGA